MTGSHHLPLVVVSAIVAMIAFHAVPDVSGRAAQTSEFRRRIWLLGGSVAMSIGISSLLFVGMLLVEDDPAIRRVLQRYLQRRGHAVDVASEGGGALALIADNANGTPYDVIISDLRMPGIGGERLLGELQARGDGFDRRTIFISGDPRRSPDEEVDRRSAGTDPLQALRPRGTCPR